MNVFIFGNNLLCLEAIRILQKHNITIAGLCLNSPNRQKLSQEIIEESNNKNLKVFNHDDLTNEFIINEINSLNFDYAFSFAFGHILKKDFLESFKMQIINLHTSFLPFNKGSATNVFSITLNHPVGVSLHYINNLIDAGDIISQEKLKVSSIDTGKSLYIKLQNKALELLNNTIPKILDNNITSTAPTEKGNLNLVSDLHKIDLINLEETYKAKDLINLLRARTFDDYGSAYFIDDDGKKVFLRLRLNYE